MPNASKQIVRCENKCDVVQALLIFSNSACICVCFLLVFIISNYGNYHIQWDIANLYISLANVDWNIYKSIEVWNNFNRTNICVIVTFKEKKERKGLKIFGEIMIEPFSNSIKHSEILLILLSASNIVSIFCSENMDYISNISLSNLLGLSEKIQYLSTLKKQSQLFPTLGLLHLQ